MFYKPKKWRNKDYEDFIRHQPCLYAYNGRKIRCEGRVEAHHVRTNTDGGTGLKPSDCYSIPLCRRHHQVVEDHPAWLQEDFPFIFRDMVLLMAKYIDRIKGREK